MIARFPVGGFGQRNDRMVQVLGSLLGREFEPDLAYAVTEAWWRHFHQLGTVRTPPGEARREIGAAIRSILRSPRFRKAHARTDHLASCREIELDDGQRRMLGMRLEEMEELVNSRSGKDQPGSREYQDRRGSTGIGDRLCISDHESFFVEAMVVHVTHERAVSRDGVIRMTGEQLRAIAAGRHAGMR